MKRDFSDPGTKSRQKKRLKKQKENCEKPRKTGVFRAKSLTGQGKRDINR